MARPRLGRRALRLPWAYTRRSALKEGSPAPTATSSRLGTSPLQARSTRYIYYFTADMKYIAWEAE